MKTKEGRYGRLLAAKGISFGHSSTGISPRPMLVGAARNALWAFNARVSLTCLYVVARKLPRLLCGLVWIARSWEVMAHRPYGSIQNRMYPSALYCTVGLPPGFLFQSAACGPEKRKTGKG